METQEPEIAASPVEMGAYNDPVVALQLQIDKLNERLHSLEAFKELPIRPESGPAENNVALNLPALQTQVDQLDRRLRALESSKLEETHVENDIYGEGVRTRFVVKTEQESGNYTTSVGKPPWNESTGRSDTESETDLDMEFITYRNKDKTRQKIEIQIYSEALLKLMRPIMKDLLTHGVVFRAWSEKPVVITTQNMNVIHCWDKLSEAASSQQDEPADPTTNDARKQLRYLLRFFKQSETEMMHARENINIAKQIQIDDLWILFPPGAEILYKPFLNQPQLFIVESVNWVGSDPAFLCWTYDWDGSDLVRQLYDFKIEVFKGIKSIVDLPLYPLRFYKDGKEDVKALRKQLIDRGKKFKSLCMSSNSGRNLLRSRGPIRITLKDYQDSYEELNSIRERKETLSPKKEPFKVIVDASMYDKYSHGGNWLGSKIPLLNQPCTCNLCNPLGKVEHWRSLFKTPEEEIDNYGNMSKNEYENFFALLPPRVLGYSLDRKQWAQIPVDSISQDQLQNYENQWKSLSLSDKHKNTMRGMVRAHLEQALSANSKGQIKRVRDPVEGKGEGLVILLHGIPGVGKTLTAEILAMVLHCPLLRIDASDLDYDSPKQVDETLKQYFEMSSSWGAILLLDEADVFLQARVRSEFKQNALVSVLLRSLEYFQGVLIMTTNRIMTVDVAIQSRIHYAIRFGHLDSSSIKNVWSFFGNQLDASNCAEGHKDRVMNWFEENAKDALTSSQFNGRDIRNLFFSAQLLALAKDDKKLTLEDIKDVYKSTTEFRRDLEKSRTQAEAQGSVL